MEISFQRAIIVYSNTNSAPIKEKTDGATLAVLKYNERRKFISL